MNQFCPACGEKVAADAVRCRYCTKFLDPASAGLEAKPSGGPEASLPFLRRRIAEPGCCLFYLGLLVALTFASLSISPYAFGPVPVDEILLPVGVGLILFAVGAMLIFRDLFLLKRRKGFLVEIRPIDFCSAGLIFSFIMAIAIPNVIEARRPTSDTAPIGALKTIGTAQSLFRESDKEADGNLDYGTLAELAAAGNTGLIDQVLGSGTKNGYLFACTYGASTSEFIWYATATPVEPGVTGERYYATNYEGVTFYTYSGSFRLNSADCTVPAGAVPVGR